MNEMDLPGRVYWSSLLVKFTSQARWQSNLAIIRFAAMHQVRSHASNLHSRHDEWRSSTREALKINARLAARACDAFV